MSVRQMARSASEQMIIPTISIAVLSFVMLKSLGKGVTAIR